MENKLMTMTNKDLTIDTREVAEMLGKEHKQVLRMIQGSKDGKDIGIAPALLKANFVLSEYFIESSYKDGSGKSNKCYLCTRLGCDLLGNKLQGERGIVFSAKYVKRFNQMETLIKDNQLVLANSQIKELEGTLKNTLDEFKRATEEAREMYKPSHKRKLQYDKLIKSVTSDKEEYDIVKEWIFATLEIEKWEDTSIEQNKKILEIIHTVSRMLNIKKFEQLSLV